MSLLSSLFDELAARPVVEGSQDAAKAAAAQEALSLVESGMVLGLGTGSTVEYFLRGLAERIAGGLEVSGVPTSTVTERRARELGIPLLGSSDDFPRLKSDLCVDGADRVELGGGLIKGGGGALLREKMVAQNSARVCILVDPSKMIPVFDDSFALPVECVKFGIEETLAALAGFGCRVRLRQRADGAPLVTDNGNFIADCAFAQIADPVAMELQVKALTGVVEVGIFTGLLDSLVIGYPDGSTVVWSR